MRASFYWTTVALLVAACTSTTALRAADVSTVDLAKWGQPSISSVGNDPLGQLIKYGYALVVDTANQIGPAVSDTTKRYSGNNLTCQSCHLRGGAQPYALPLVGEA